MDNYAFERAMINHVNDNAEKKAQIRVDEKKAQIREDEKKKRCKHRRQEKAIISAILFTAFFIVGTCVLIRFEQLGWMNGWIAVVTAMLGFNSGIQVGGLLREI